MTASRVALVAAVGAVLAWAAKAVAIWIAGGLDLSPAEGPLFFLGLLCALTGAVALGLAVSAGRGAPMRVVITFVAVATVVLVAGLFGWFAVLLEPDDPSWVWGEVNLWVSAVVLLSAVLLQRRLADDRQ